MKESNEAILGSFIVGGILAVFIAIGIYISDPTVPKWAVYGFSMTVFFVIYDIMLVRTDIERVERLIKKGEGR